MSEVSENIKKFRKSRGLKQSELGKLVGKAPSVIANWEAGTNRPDVDSLKKLCKVFEIDANTLFGWENKKVAPEQIESDADITKNEYAHIKKYRALDEHGKEMIDTVLEKETQRIEAEKSKTVDDDRPYLIAARGGKEILEVHDKNKKAAIDDLFNDVEAGGDDAR